MNQGAVDLEDKARKQLPCSLVDVTIVCASVCEYACVLQAAAGTTLDELSCLRCLPLPKQTNMTPRGPIERKTNARADLVSTGWCQQISAQTIEGVWDDHTS